MHEYSVVKNVSCYLTIIDIKLQMKMASELYEFLMCTHHARIMYVMYVRTLILLQF